ncbi:MAG TPA: hypothetical protein VHY22_17745 [Chthoniobacteraceae bacterium]|nr:hypothetical protein [Chthoniobacteraceae bacterium]
MKYLACLVLLMGMGANAAEIPAAELARIGRKVWDNECAGTISGLTSWNVGEDFASLGIGHFIWYPAGKRGPFEESFPLLVDYLEAHGQRVPGWLHGPCPWNTRTDFLVALQSERMDRLRALLANTTTLQAGFLAKRMHEALPKMLAAAPPQDAGRVRQNFERLAATGPGTFALIDYVNFKGEGTLPTERYHGEGWGLLQVLAAMPENGNALREFSHAARAMLERRVRNAPPERHEERWLPGWDSRVDRYAE